MNTIKTVTLGFVFIAVSLAEETLQKQPYCDANAKCVGYYEGFNCTCNSGYKGSDFGCENINECVETPEVCTDVETCNDIIGSYNCTCGHIDIICHHKAVCIVDSSNDTVCQCVEGYTGNGTYCVDIDECIMRTDNCSSNALCQNTIGSYKCQCFDGFEGDGFVCKDIDECERGTYQCNLPETCNNTIGSYSCVCGDDGFCDDNGYCIKIENVTSCICKDGYKGTGVECSDIDECKEPSQKCHTHATCVNTKGSFRCVCNEPYRGDGFECSSARSVVFSMLSLITSMIFVFMIKE